MAESRKICCCYPARIVLSGSTGGFFDILGTFFTRHLEFVREVFVSIDKGHCRIVWQMGFWGENWNLTSIITQREKTDEFWFGGGSFSEKSHAAIKGVLAQGTEMCPFEIEIQTCERNYISVLNRHAVNSKNFVYCTIYYIYVFLKCCGVHNSDRSVPGSQQLKAALQPISCTTILPAAVVARRTRQHDKTIVWCHKMP